MNTLSTLSGRMDGMTDSPAPQDAGAAAFGRVDPDGTVYVRTAEGERAVGQVPDVPAADALAFFTRRYEALELEVGLLQSRISTGALSPDDALASVRTVRAAVVEAHAVGDLDGLVRRLDGLLPVIATQRAARRAERARQQEQTRAAKEQFVLEAERLAVGNDWRGGVNRFRALLEQWKALPRLDRATDDELWHRFSSARTAYTRRRKAQFAAQNTAREAARVTKEAAGRGGGGTRDLDRLGADHRGVPRADGALEGRRTRAARGGRGTVEAVSGRAGHLLRRQAGGAEPAGQRVPGERRGEGGAAGRGGGVAPGPRSRRGSRGVPGHLESLGGDRQGAPRRHPHPGQPAARGGDRDRRGRRASAGGGPTRRLGPGPRTRRPSSRRRSSPWRSGPPRPRRAATTGPPGRRPSRRRRTGNGSPRPSGRPATSAA